MTDFQGNWVDLVVLGVLIFFAWDGWQKGVVWLLAQLGSFVGGLMLAFGSYSWVAELLVNNFRVSRGLGNAVGFLVMAFVAEEILARAFFYGVNQLFGESSLSWWERLLGIIPSGLSGLVLSAFFLSFLISVPIQPKVKRDILESEIGGVLVSEASGIERRLEGIFGEATKETLSFLTTPVESDERVRLGFHLEQEDYRVDRFLGKEMMELVNQERVRVGVERVEWFDLAEDAGVSHSIDMVVRGYFSHQSLEGEDAGDRLEREGVRFVVAGENLALAPTIELAHQGLMESEGHRANILSKDFSRVGIGVVDAGIYGKVVTQVFVD